MPDSPPRPARPERVLVAALAAENRVIGRGMELPWHLPADLRHFKTITSGGTLVMGRRTFESLVHQMGGPLPGRRHLVVTRDASWTHPGAETHPTLDDAFAAADAEARVFVAGGGEVYAQTLTWCDRWELTLIEGSFEGDVAFPPFEHLVGAEGSGRPFVETRRESHPAEAGRPAFSFVTCVRTGSQTGREILP